MQKGEGLVVINDHRIDKILEKKEVMLYNNNICMDNFARRKSWRGDMLTLGRLMKEYKEGEEGYSYDGW